MSNLNLMLHCGGVHVDRSALSKVELPAPTDSYQPIAHNVFVDMLQDELENAGLTVTAEAHGLTRTAKARYANQVDDNTWGGNYFGMFQVEGPQLLSKDHSTVVGFRNSHIKRLSAAIALGSGVFVCDNLSFLGEVTAFRKHTKNAMDSDKGIRPTLVDAISKLLITNTKQEERFEAYKVNDLARGSAEVVMVDMLREKVVTSTQLPKLVQQWDTPDHEEFAKHQNGWRMFNAVTETLKGTSPIELPRRTAKLHRILDKQFDIEPLDFDLARAA